MRNGVSAREWAPGAVSSNPFCNGIILSGALGAHARVGGHAACSTSTPGVRSGVKGARRVILSGYPRMERKRWVQSETTSSLRSGREEIHSESTSSLTLRALRSLGSSLRMTSPSRPQKDLLNVHWERVGMATPAAVSTRTSTPLHPSALTHHLLSERTTAD